ncbi:MAG TPA: diaminopimelate decarboxylase [Candidatus Rubrimentiphilum sp.]|nr:diaminopimelate decarboxylase [Candidatus Rubrimentiphilum sp.]
MIRNSSAPAQWRGGLAPGHERRDGELIVGGVSAGELAAAYGTPLLAIDYDVFDAAIARFLEACAPHGIEVAYAGKALLLVALARHLKHTPLHLDVCSLGELAAAERAGFPPERMSFHGCGKTTEELDAAAEGRVARVIVDNGEELRRLTALGNSAPIAVLLRINPGIEAHTHEFVRTAGGKTKFGFDPDGLAVAIPLLSESPGLRYEGLHAHIGSQIYDRHAFVENTQALMERAAVAAAAGLQSERIVVGGGFGVQMHPDDRNELNLEETLAAVAQAVSKGAKRWNLPEPRIGIEPGRSLIAEAGTTLYRVMAAKREFGKAFAIVDGGVYENPRPALYGAYHHAYAASREGTKDIDTILCGRSCENDELGVAKLPEDLSEGELVAMCTTGAYTYSMAGNYNRFPRPAVVAVRAGTHTLIARRETVEDVLRNDCDE